MEWIGDEVKGTVNESNRRGMNCHTSHTIVQVSNATAGCQNKLEDRKPVYKNPKTVAIFFVCKTYTLFVWEYKILPRFYSLFLNTFIFIIAPITFS